jgi:hypothetical protein
MSRNRKVRQANEAKFDVSAACSGPLGASLQRTIAALSVLLLLGACPAPIGAAEQPDADMAFRMPGGGVQALTGSQITSQPAAPDAGASLLTPAANTVAPPIIDRTPVTFHFPPMTQVAQAAGASSPPTSAAPEHAEAGEQSLTEINKQLSNPVTSLWSMSFQFNNYQLVNNQWNFDLQFQPVMPVSLTKDWNLITRPVVPLYNSVPVATGPDTFSQKTGFGDIILLEMLSPANSGPWLLGAGPTFIFPSASSKETGQGKWQAGPGALVGYLSKEYILGLFPQQWWSIGGSNGRPYTSQLNLQPIAAWFFAPGWNLGYSGNILADWMAPSRDVWTVPLGLALGKVVKLGPLPVKLQIATQYMVQRPRNTGQEWNIQFSITPVIPKLIKGVLFD